MEAPNALAAGHALQEYRIEKVLGVGGFGLTYLALDENLHLRVAVKEYLPADIALRAPDCSIAPRSERSEERRVGKECRSRWGPDQEKKKEEREEWKKVLKWTNRGEMEERWE